MGRAFRADVLEAPQIAQEIGALEHRIDIVPPETINCPVQGCAVQYVLYNYLFSDRARNLETLFYGLRIHHPNHPAHFILNEPRTE